LKIERIADHVDWLVINKPAGISMQIEQNDPQTLSLQQQVQLQFQLEQIFPVHRLDKATSGLVIFAKSSAAAAEFTRLFSEKQVEKRYIALANGKPKKKQGWIKGDMAKGRNGSWLLQRSMNNPAQTYFQSVAIDVKKYHANRLYLLTPKTGKTHQLRVAMKSNGVAILGDERYKGDNAERCYLHALWLCFNWLGEQVELHAFPTQGNWPELHQLDLTNELTA